MKTDTLPDLTEREWRKGFWSLFWVQSQGAFSDNLFKFLVIFLITSTMAEAERDLQITIILVLFSLPFILFSMTGGYLADRYPKRSVVIGTKVFEIVVMFAGTAALMTRSLPFLYTVMFLMSVQSAFFGPSKYSLLPEMLPDSKLSWGNGLIGLGTFISIILGGVVAGEIFDFLQGERLWLAGVGLVLLAVVGTFGSLGIAHRPAADPLKRYEPIFVAEIWNQMRRIGRDRVLALAVSGIVYFWFLAALFGDPTLLVYCKDVLGLSEAETSRLRACVAVGIGLGSAMAGWLSGRKIEYGLVPLGALGLATCSALMAIPGLLTWQVALIVAGLGFSGGFFSVPLNALIQHRPAPEEKGAIIATESWLTSAGVFAASGIFWVMKSALGLAPGTIYLIGAVVTLIATVAAMRLVPDSLMRLVLWMLTHTIYRVKVEGRDNIPEKGGALFVCNHLSLADACFLIASTDRPIRFLMYRGMYEKWWIHPIAKMLRVIPVSAESRPRELIQSLQTATQAIEAGEVACIFAEGQITRTGQMLPFRRGFTRIMKGLKAPVIPVHLDNVWGSIFSFEHGRFYSKLPHRLPYPVTVSYGTPLPADADPFTVRQAVQELGAEAWVHRKMRMKPLHRSFVETARRFPRRFAFADSATPPVKFFAALTRSIYLARRFRRVWEGEEKVGLLLPPSVGGALLNYAALLLGKVPVNLNYTLSAEALASCIRQCGIRRVVTSEKFLSKLNLTLPVETVFIEQAAANPGIGEKISAFLMAALCPASRIDTALGASRRATMDDLATIIFSSGSTGDPKGVMLSHFNVGANITQIGQVMDFRTDDRLLGILPFFHSFGFTGTLGAPAMLGLGVAYHFNPTDARTVGHLVQEHRVTFLLATPTFLQLYLRGCQPEQFGSLRFVMVGAEKLPERLAVAFEDRFGLRPMEAYGCTECSPAVTVNTYDFRAPGIRQVGGKRGSIGHPLPGVTVRIVDPATGEPRPVGEPGLMCLKGPNIMQGYLGQPEKSAAVLQGGWYVTGDIAAVDEDGFVTITDRLSRFSKIGGEMVPHIKIEECLQEQAGVTAQVFAVTGVPDEKKGEKLIVLHTLPGPELDGVLAKLGSADLPNLWKPKRDQFLRVEAIPVLGTGKVDLRKVKEIAQAGPREVEEEAAGPPGPDEVKD